MKFKATYYDYETGNMKKLTWIIITSKTGKSVKEEWSRFGDFEADIDPYPGGLADRYCHSHKDYDPDAYYELVSKDYFDFFGTPYL